MSKKYLFFFCIVGIFINKNSYSQNESRIEKGTCSGLALGQSDRIDVFPDTMEGIIQAENQSDVTNPVATRSIRSGFKLFGSCATFTSIARVIAILRKEGLPIPTDFEVSEDNIRKFFISYGDLGRGGVGIAEIVTANILNEYIEKYCQEEQPTLKDKFKEQLKQFEEVSRFPALLCMEEDLTIPKKCKLEMISKYLKNFPQKNRLSQKIKTKSYLYRSSKHNTSINEMANGMANYFNTSPPRVPIELIHSGVGLHNTAEGAKARKPSRNGHVSLITGRRLLKNGQCQILVRNSWKGSCVLGVYNRTNRECDEDTDSTWFSDDHLFRFTSEIKIVE